MRGANGAGCGAASRRTRPLPAARHAHGTRRARAGGLECPEPRERPRQDHQDRQDRQDRQDVDMNQSRKYIGEAPEPTCARTLFPSASKLNNLGCMP